ncbi:MAG: hypothetical protein PVG79_04310, partial [Gemmatimonadales bacterium]
WPDWHHLTGYWFLDRPDDWRPPARVTEFLEAGPPPVYVGFSSMMPRDPAAMIEIVLGALRRAGSRGIVATGWMAPAARDLPDDVLVLDEIPHDWLFPKVAPVVHHGGAGTTAAAMRAGAPAVVVRRLTAERLADAIRAAVTDEGMRRRSAELGERLRAEDGVGKAVAIIDRELQ